MTGKQTAVMWIGLLIVLGNLALRWSEIRNVIFSGAMFTPSNPSGSGGSGSGGAPATPSLPWWIPHWPGTTIPLISAQSSSSNSSPKQQVV